MAENKSLLWVLLGGLGLYAAYRYMKNKGAAPAAMQPALSPAGQVDVSPPSLLTATPPQPAIQQSSAPNGIDPTVYATVYKWSEGDGRPPVLAFAQAAVPAEYNTLYEIMTDFWEKGIKVPYGSPQQQFWDSLRSKYDPNHQYW